MKHIFEDIEDEMESQDEKWGMQNHPHHTWNSILGEETGEVSTECLEIDHGKDSSDLRKELVQVAAVAVQWINHLDKQENSFLYDSDGELKPNVFVKVYYDDEDVNDCIFFKVDQIFDCGRIDYVTHVGSGWKGTLEKEALKFIVHYDVTPDEKIQRPFKRYEYFLG